MAIYAGDCAFHLSRTRVLEFVLAACSRAAGLVFDRLEIPAGFPGLSRLSQTRPARSVRHAAYLAVWTLLVAALLIPTVILFHDKPWLSRRAGHCFIDTVGQDWFLPDHAGVEPARLAPLREVRAELERRPRPCPAAVPARSQARELARLREPARGQHRSLQPAVGWYRPARGSRSRL
jgi:hypothetical protein